MLHVLFCLLSLTHAYTDLELQLGEACMKLIIVYHSFGDSRVYEVVKQREDLDAQKLEERIMMDMFAFCTKNADPRDITEMIKANSKEHLDSFARYLHFSPAKYQVKDVDLTVTKEEIAFRNAATRPRARMRIADMESTREALEYAERVRRERAEAKNLL